MNNNFPPNPNIQMQSAMQMNQQVLPVPTMPPQTLPQVQMPNLPNVIPLPITVRVTSSPTNGDTDAKTDREMLEGKVIRTTFNCNVMSVAAFIRAYLVTKKPHHLLDLIHLHWNDQKSSSSSKGKGGVAGVLGTVGIRFGDGVNDFTVILKDEGTNGSNSTSSGSSNKTDLVLSLFLKEGDKKVPAMLDPTDNMYNIIQGCNLTKGPAELVLCPSKLWLPHVSPSVGPEPTITLLLKNNHLYKVLFDNQDASHVAGEGASVSAGIGADTTATSTTTALNATVSSSTETASKKRKKKDPNAPKAKRSAFTFFLSSERSKFTKENPDADFSSISKTLGKKWREISPERKKGFEDMAAKDKGRYEKEMETYVAPVEEENDTTDHSNTKNEIGDKQQPRKKKAKKDPNQPKGPRNIYWYFCNEQRPIFTAKQPELNFQGLNLALSGMYKKLSDSEKQRYRDMAIDDKKRFDDEMERYRSGSFTGSVASKEIDGGEKGTTVKSVEEEESSDKGTKDKEAKLSKKKKSGSSKTETPKKQSTRKILLKKEEEETPVGARRSSRKVESAKSATKAAEKKKRKK